MNRPHARGCIRSALLAWLLCGGIGAAAAENLASYSGMELYQRYCAACHGVEAHGDGPVAADLNVMVPDLTRLAHRHGGVFPVDDVRRIIDGRSVHVAHGTRDMPVWGNRFREAVGNDTQGNGGADDLIERLVEYLRSIQSR